MREKREPDEEELYDNLRLERRKHVFDKESADDWNSDSELEALTGAFDRGRYLGYTFQNMCDRTCRSLLAMVIMIDCKLHARKLEG